MARKNRVWKSFHPITELETEKTEKGSRTLGTKTRRVEGATTKAGGGKASERIY